MTTSLPLVAHEQHEILLHTVDTLPAFGDALVTASTAEIRPRVEEIDSFLSDILVPHMEAAERTLYPELERMLQNRHSMTPMRKEHDEIRALVAGLHRLGSSLDEPRPSLARTLALRRVVFRLYALLKVHLVEEELYVRVVNKGVTADVAELLAAGIAHPLSSAH